MTPASSPSTLQVRTTRKARADGATSSSSSIVVVRHVKILVTQQPTISKSAAGVSFGPRLDVRFRLPLLLIKAFLYGKGGTNVRHGGGQAEVQHRKHTNGKRRRVILPKDGTSAS